MKLAKNLTKLIGNTPMVRLNALPNKEDATIYAKLESYNPGGSIKDRISYGMVVDAEKRGILKPGDTIVEPTAGNTGIGLSIVGVARGYHVILTMPEYVSSEKYALLSAFGADIVLTPEHGGMASAIWEAEEIIRRNSRHYMPNQFANPANPQIHRQTTAIEILKSVGSNIDYLVIGVGTGGTLTGVGEVIKSHNPKTKIVAVEPLVSSVLSGGMPGPTRIDGLGAGMVPEVLNVDIIDDVIPVSEETAYEMMKEISKKEGLLVGMSSGANVYASLQVAQGIGPEKTVVTILPDTGERYFSLSRYFELETGIMETIS
ncbi:MAG: cysteine synthase A [Candidatus Poribacteria bacterium]|nr:cysteine synthase A [Candidatus Poribacteria bacterium]